MKLVRLTGFALTLLLTSAGAFAQTADRVPMIEVSTAMVRTVADAAMSGTAAWYGRKFNGRRTASGERFNASALTAAHASLPFGTRVRVTNTENRKSVVVTINDRLNASAGRVIDMSRASAQRLGMIKDGTAPVRIERVGARAAAKKTGKTTQGNAGRGTINRQR